jgi:hypothetical protein
MIPNKYLILAFIVLSLLGGTYIKGRSDGIAKVEAQVAAERREWEDKVAKTQAESDKKAAEIAEQYASVTSQYQVELSKLLTTVTDAKGKVTPPQVVTVYVPVGADSFVPNGFVDLHNTTAAGRPLSGIAKENAGEQSTKKLSDVGTVVSKNYYMCNAVIAQLESLQAVVRQYQEQQQKLIK